MLIEIKSKLGYKINPETYPSKSSKRFYSDLRLIPDSIYGKEFKEYKE